MMMLEKTTSLCVACQISNVTVLSLFLKLGSDLVTSSFAIKRGYDAFFAVCSKRSKDRYVVLLS